MIYNFDVTVFRWLNSWAFWREWADAAIIFRAVFLGWWVLAGLLVFGVLALLPRFRHLLRKNWEMIGVTLAGALVARFGIVELIRAFYNRPRPFEVIEGINQIFSHAPGGSFPSGHAAFYFAIAAGVSRYYPKTSVLFYAAALSISISRVAAGIHWPSDILGGAAIGIAVGLAIHWLYRKYLKPKPAPKLFMPGSRSSQTT